MAIALTARASRRARSAHEDAIGRPSTNPTPAFLATATLLAFAACGGRTGFVDSANGVSGAPDAASDSPSDVVAPRAIAPLSTSRVTTRRPTLRWALPSGVSDATVDLCLDRACTRMIGTPAHVTGSSYAPPTDLPVGTVFWRLHPSTVTSVTSPTWQFTVGARSAPVDSSWGTTFDVNGDGFADVVVGAPSVNNSAGAAYVYLGGATGLATMPATTLVAPKGETAFGNVESAGDVNGDGFADLVVTTPSTTPSSCIYVYLGGMAGLADTPVSTRCATAAASWFVESAGDVNGDGYADIVVGDFDSDAAPVFVYLGSQTGLAMTPATVSVPHYDGGSASFEYVASAGDVNGDGFGDLIACFLDYPNGVFIDVYLGSATGLAATPASTPFFSDHLDDGNLCFATSAGDVNGDGYADVFVAGSSFGPGFVHLGSAGGVVPTPATTLATPVDGGSWGGTLGGSAIAGDVNGDGYGDVVVEAHARPGEWPVYVYLGSAAGLATAPAAAPEDPQLEVDEFSAFASAGDVNGDGFDDLVASGLDVDYSGVSVCIYLGNVTGLAATPAVTLVGPGGDFGVSVY
jgi:hypothetical protein